MQSKQYFTKIKNYPHEKSTEPVFPFAIFIDEMGENRRMQTKRELRTNILFLIISIT